MVSEYLFNAFIFKRERLAFIGPLQSFDQCRKLQVRNLLAQALAKARAQTVGQSWSLARVAVSAA